MNKFLTKIATAFVGIAMAIGVGVAVGSKSEVKTAHAGNASIAFDFTSSYSGINATGSVTKNELYETGNSFNSTYTFYYINCYSASGYLMCGSKAKGAATLFSNKTAMPGDIVRVTITPSSGCSASASWKLSTGTSAFTSALSSANKTSSGKSEFYWEPSTTTNVRYFAVTSSSTSYNGQIGTISVTYVSQAQTYTVTYDANGGTGTVPTESSAFEANANVTAKFPSDLTPPSDKVFKNWKLNNASTGTEIGVRSTFQMPSQNSTLYANWVDKPSSVTFNATSDLGGSTSTGVGVYKLGTSIDATTGVLNGGTNYQFYKNSVVTFSSYYNITRIDFTNVSSDPISNFTVDVGTLSETRWTGKAKTINFTASTAQVKTTGIVVTYESTIPSVELNHTSVELKTNQTEGLTVEATVQNVETPTYSWAANNGNVTLEGANTNIVTIKPNTNVAASSTITLTVGGTTPNLTASVTVTISVPGPGETAGTAYTVAQASAAITAASENISNVYITGKISQIDEVSVPNGNATYWISDDGTTSGQFKVYRGKYLNNVNFTSDDQITVGDTVIVFGTISKSYTNLNQGNYIVSITPVPKVNSISLTPAIVTVAPEDAGDIVDLFTNIVINQDAGSNKTVNDIVWSTDDEDVFYIDAGEYLVAGEHKESTTIHASIGGRQYASATVNVIDSSHPFITYDVPVTWTVVADPSTLVAGDKVILTGVKDEVCYAAGTYSSGNNVPADTTNTLTISGSNVTGVVSTMIYTLVTGSESGTLAFKDSAGKYLYAPSSSSNYLKSQADIDGNASFILNSDGTVVAQGSNSHKYMRYNNTSSSNLFSCYGSSSTTGDLVTFYKQSGGGSNTIDLDNTILTLVRSYMATYQDEHGDDQFGISICNYNGSTLNKSDWDDMGDDFTSSVINTYKLNYARSNAAGNDVEKFLSAYDYVVTKYGASYDFLGRIASGKVTPQSSASIIPIASNSSTTTIVIVISMISLISVSGFFFLRRRKEQ